MVLTVHEVFSLLGSCNSGLCWEFGAPHFGCLCFLDKNPVFIVMPSWNHSNTLYQLALDTWRVRDPLKIIILKSQGIPASGHIFGVWTSKESLNFGCSTFSTSQNSSSLRSLQDYLVQGGGCEGEIDLTEADCSDWIRTLSRARHRRHPQSMRQTGGSWEFPKSW